MNCFPCFSSQRSKKSTSKREHASPQDLNEPRTPEMKKQKPTVDNKDQNYQVDSGNIAAETFTFRELATATKNFRQESLLGEGGFGRVYKGVIQRTGQVVAVKQLDRNGMDGNKEFLSEVLSLSLIHHDNLVNLIGYCADGDQRLLVYEYMPMGSLEDHLLEIKPKRKPLDWIARMKIAYGAAQGLEYLHDKVNPPVIYQDLKSSSVLLDEELHPKLSDLGLAKVCPSGNKMPLSSRALGTYGYSAPEYSRGDHLSVKADVYSFGVVLLEIITGRRAVDTTRPNEEQNLVTWAQPIFKDPSKFSGMADPLLKKRFPERDLNQVVAIAAMCLQEEAAARPLMSDVVTALSFLSMVKEEDIPAPLPEKDTKPENSNSAKYEDEDSSTDSDGENSDHQSLNSSFSLDGESVHKANGKQVVRKSKKLGSNSKSKNQERSPDKSTLSSRKSSMSSEEMNHSSRPENRKGSDGESASSGDESSKGSHGLSQRCKNGLKNENVTLSRKSSKNLFLSFAHKSSEKSQDDDTFSISSDSSDGSVSSSCKSERKSLDGREYSSRHHKSSSKRSSSRGASLKHKNSKGSRKENVSLDHDSSDESQEDGSVYSS